MATTIAILLFSAATLTLLTFLFLSVLRQNRDTSREILTTMDQMARTLTTSTNMVSSDMADSVTRMMKEQQTTFETLFLGREAQYTSSVVQQNSENEKQQIPGIDTLDGLPTHVRESILRESMEDERQERREWQTISGTPLSDSERHLAAESLLSQDDLLTMDQSNQTPPQSNGSSSDSTSEAI